MAGVCVFCCCLRFRLVFILFVGLCVAFFGFGWCLRFSLRCRFSVDMYLVGVCVLRWCLYFRLVPIFFVGVSTFSCWLRFFCVWIFSWCLRFWLMFWLVVFTSYCGFWFTYRQYWSWNMRGRKKCRSIERHDNRIKRDHTVFFLFKIYCLF